MKFHSTPFGIVRTFSRAVMESIVSQFYFPLFEEPYMSLCKSLQNISQNMWSDTNTSATLLFESYMQWIEIKYVSSDKTALRHFLTEHPSLAPLLVATYTHLKIHFPDLQVFLDIVTDYEEAKTHKEQRTQQKKLRSLLVLLYLQKMQ